MFDFSSKRNHMRRLLRAVLPSEPPLKGVGNG